MKKVLLSLLLVAVVGGSIAWFKRADILLALVKYQAGQRYVDVAPTREIPWQQGPAESAAPHGERSPNIILIVADERYLR